MPIGHSSLSQEVGLAMKVWVPCRRTSCCRRQLRPGNKYPSRMNVQRRSPYLGRGEMLVWGGNPEVWLSGKMRLEQGYFPACIRAILSRRSIA